MPLFPIMQPFSRMVFPLKRSGCSINRKVTKIPFISHIPFIYIYKSHYITLYHHDIPIISPLIPNIYIPISRSQAEARLDFKPSSTARPPGRTQGRRGSAIASVFAVSAWQGRRFWGVLTDICGWDQWGYTVRRMEICIFYHIIWYYLTVCWDYGGISWILNLGIAWCSDQKLGNQRSFPPKMLLTGLTP